MNTAPRRPFMRRPSGSRPVRDRTRALAVGAGLGACVLASGCRGGGPFLAAKPTAGDPFLAAAAAGAADEGRVVLSEPAVGSPSSVVKTASLDAAPPAVTRVDPFAAPAPRSGGWLPGDGTNEEEAKPGDGAFASTGPAPAPAAPPAPVDWAAEMAAFAQPADAPAAGVVRASATAPAAAAGAAPAADPFAPAPPTAPPAAVTVAAVEPRPAPAFDPDDLPPAPKWDPAPEPGPAEPAAAGSVAADPLDDKQPRPTALGGGTDGWHSRRARDIDPFAP